jgi:hypothetical protein
MILKRLILPRCIVLAIVVVTGSVFIFGCDEDKRVAEIATESAKRQAAQDIEMARLNREIAEGSKRLVAANEKLLTAQHDLNGQRDQIDGERRSLATERHRESLLGPIVCVGGWVLVGALPLVLCLYLLHGLRHGNEDVEIGHLLMEEFVSDQPTLLPPFPGGTSIDQPSRKALDFPNDPHADA